MNIVMMTNTFTPHVGGVARSIEQFAAKYREWGHKVLVVAPEFDGMPADETDVIRVPAIRNFNHTDFSVITPTPHLLHDAIEAFKPDIIHSHHPFLLGGIALRVAHSANIPLVFTHHTKYEDYTHNLSVDTEQVKQFAINLATNYANTCDQVFAPSESIKEIIQQRGVRTKIDVVPTGVVSGRFASAKRQPFRQSLGISEDAFVVGHLGRISKEKNIEFMVESVIEFLKSKNAPPNACFMICGDGPTMPVIDQMFYEAGLNQCLFKTGVLDRDAVPDAFAAMDVFTFTSQSETQGMVITEAMAAGTPVVALDAPGVKDVVKDGINGRMISTPNRHEFSTAISSVAMLNTDAYQAMKAAALDTADQFSMSNSATTAINSYRECIERTTHHRPHEFNVFSKTLHLFEAEWKRISNTFNAVAESFL